MFSLILCGVPKAMSSRLLLCSAYIRIAKTCPPHIWKPQSLVYMLCSPEPCFPLIDYFQVAVFLLGPDRVGGRTTKGCSTALSTSIGKGVQSSRVGEKRTVQDLETYRSKRQKVKEEILTSNDDDQVARPVQDLGTSRSKRQKVKEVLTSNDDVQVAHELAPVITREREEEYADNLHNSLLLFAEHLEPPSVKANSLKPEVAMIALSILCIAFCKYPETNLSICIFQHMQAKQGNSISFDLSIYLEAVHSILLLRGPFGRENKLFRNKGDGVDLLHVVLKLPWKHSLVVTEPHRPWKLKCLSLQVLSKIGPNLNTESDLEVLDLGLHDEAEEVRRAAVILMPVIVSWSGHGVLTHMFRFQKGGVPGQR